MVEDPERYDKLQPRQRLAFSRERSGKVCYPFLQKIHFYKIISFSRNNTPNTLFIY